MSQEITIKPVGAENYSDKYDREFPAFNRFAMKSLIMLFYRNPGLIDTTSGIASRIGLMEEQIQTGMKKMVLLDLVSEKKLGKNLFYCRSRKANEIFRESMNDNRIKAILEEMQKVG